MKNTQLAGSRLEALRHDGTLEWYTWGTQRWSISRIRLDVQDAVLRPKKDTFGREFIVQYAEQVLAQRRAEPPTSGTRRVGVLAHVDAWAASQMPPAVLDQPLIMLDAGPRRGILTLPGRPEASFVLADGSHRLCKAYFEDVLTLPVLVLSLAQARRYLD